MKKLLTLLAITSVILLALTSCGFILGFGIDDTEQNSLEFTSNGDGTCRVGGVFGFVGAEVVIPSTSPDGDRVTSIEDNAFFACSSLISIDIPDSVTSIGGSAFFGCENLASIDIPDSVTSIGVWAFNGTALYEDESNWENDVLYIGKHLIEAEDTISGEYTIKEGTLTVASSAFSLCSDLTSIVMPDSLTNIDNGAFMNCSNLASVAIPDSVKSIGESAFDSCTSLASIVIPDGVTSVGPLAFSHCWDLTSVVIGDSVASIGDGAFDNCSDLSSITVAEDNASYKSIDGNLYSKDGKTLIQYAVGKADTEFTLPESVTDIREKALYYCSNLTDIKVAENNAGYTSIDGNLYTKDGKVIVQYAVGKEDAEFVIPDGVIGIGNYAFHGSYDLTSVVIPGSVTSVGNEAFSYCWNLTSVVIGDSVTNIGDEAFSGCDLITSIVIPDSVTSIGNGAFSCDKLTDIYYTGSEAEWNNISIGEDNEDLTNATIHYNYKV